MSKLRWSDFLWTPQFLTGSFVSGVLGSVITYFNTKASDERKFGHEHEVLDRKEWREDAVLDRKEKREDLTEEEKRKREDKLREEQSLIAAADEFSQICSGILVDSIDTEGAFNMIRDMFNSNTGRPDSAVDKKLAHGQKVAEAQKRIASPHYRLKMTADSPEVLAAADKVAVAILAVARMTVEPFAVVITQKVAADEMNNFAMVIRKELGKTEYSSEDSKKAALSFIDTLQRQTDDFVEHARDELKAAGFRTTPWDNYVRKTSKVPPPVI